MSNQFFRHEKQKEEQAQKELQERAQKLFIVLNSAICKYNRTIEIFNKLEKNGALLPKRMVLTPKAFEYNEARRFLFQNKIEPPQKKWVLFPKKAFLKEIEQAEKELNVSLLPSLKITPFGITPSYAVGERLKKTEELNLGAKPSDTTSSPASVQDPDHSD